MFALIDCNNFYVSCERLFRPDLKTRPIIVLSNNDGCVIARSNEAKTLGIKMGVPYFEVKSLCKQHKVEVFSSNYTLYGDLSERVMSIIQAEWSETELYSIDEAFLNLSTLAYSKIAHFCNDLQKLILKQTGIPTTIGVGRTKTLAKIANHLAKKTFKIPVFHLNNEDHSKWLSLIKVNDIWGVGFQWSKKLGTLGIKNANELKTMDISFVKKRFNVVLQRTVMELNGIPCLDLEVIEPKQSIMSSCSFGGLRTDFNELAESISHHCATAWNKMRSQGLITQHMSVFIKSNPFRKDLQQYSNCAGFKLIYPTDDIRLLTKYAKSCLEKIFKEGIYYYKSGVLLADLIEKKYLQQDLFSQLSNQEITKTEMVMNTLDLINKKYGPRTIRLAAEGFDKAWSMKRELKTPNYTTQWCEIPIVHLR